MATTDSIQDNIPDTTATLLHSFADPDLEKLYRSHSAAQRRTGLQCFLLAAVLFDVYSLAVPLGQNPPAYLTSAACLVLAVLGLVWCRAGFKGCTPLWRVAPYLAWFLATSQLLLHLFLRTTAASSEAAGLTGALTSSSASYAPSSFDLPNIQQDSHLQQQQQLRRMQRHQSDINAYYDSLTKHVENKNQNGKSTDYLRHRRRRDGVSLSELLNTLDDTKFSDYSPSPKDKTSYIEKILDPDATLRNTKSSDKYEEISRIFDDLIMESSSTKDTYYRHHNKHRKGDVKYKFSDKSLDGYQNPIDYETLDNDDTEDLNDDRASSSDEDESTKYDGMEEPLRQKDELQKLKSSKLNSKIVKQRKLDDDVLTYYDRKELLESGDEDFASSGHGRHRRDSVTNDVIAPMEDATINTGAGDLQRRHQAINDVTSRDSLGWSLLLVYLVYVTLPLRLRYCAGLSLGTCVLYVTALIGLSDTQEDLVRQHLANCVLLGAANALGVMCYYLEDARQRRAFLETRQSLQVKLVIEEQSAEQERLLLSVLPEHVAVKMRQDLGSTDSQFKKIYMSRHENVSILYADIVGFTAISSTYLAQDLVKILNELFARFDRLAEKYHQLRIKILGDCYYCISGAPVERPDHAVLCVHMGLSMVKAIKYVQQTTNSPVDMRVGIHTGAVLAGVLGQRQWQFDVYSKDVELANKMESSGMAGRVHISQRTLSFLDGEFEVEPAHGERREEALRMAGIKTYFIVKVLKPFSTPVPEIRNGATNAAADNEETILAEGVYETKEEQVKCQSPVADVEEGQQAREDSEDFKTRLRKELVSRDGHRELQKRTSRVTLRFTDAATERAYDRHRERLAAWPLGAHALVAAAVAVTASAIMLGAGQIDTTRDGGATNATQNAAEENSSYYYVPVTMTAGLAALAALAVLAVAETCDKSFPRCVVLCSRAVNDSVHVRRFIAILAIVLLALVNTIDMSICYRPYEGSLLERSSPLNCSAWRNDPSNFPQSSSVNNIHQQNPMINAEERLSKRTNDFEPRRSFEGIQKRDTARQIRKLDKEEQLHISNDRNNLAYDHRIEAVMPPHDYIERKHQTQDPTSHINRHINMLYRNKEEPLNNDTHESSSEQPSSSSTNSSFSYRKSSEDDVRKKIIRKRNTRQQSAVNNNNILHRSQQQLLTDVDTADTAATSDVTNKIVRKRNTRQDEATPNDNILHRSQQRLLTDVDTAGTASDTSEETTLTMIPCRYPSYHSCRAVLCLVAAAILSQLSHMLKAAILLLLAGGHCVLNLLVLNAALDCEDHASGRIDESFAPGKLILSYMLVAVTIALSYLARHMERVSRVSFLWRTEVSEQRERAADMRRRNEALVYNVLPPHVAAHFMGRQQLTGGGGVVGGAGGAGNRHEDELYSQSYAEVGVLFASMPNFSDFYSEETVNNQGLECLRFLNEVISDFDALLELPQFKDIIKIKTIGSTYMAASGLKPTDTVHSPNATVTQRWSHLGLLVEFALELKRALHCINEQSFNHFVLKMGINHGPITAGVIGARKPHYDIWGNTVNVASRMESTGTAGAIQVTEETRDILHQLGYTFEQRGLVAVKGKGQLMTYYLQGKLPPPPQPQSQSKGNPAGLVTTMETLPEEDELVPSDSPCDTSPSVNNLANNNSIINITGPRDVTISGCGDVITATSNHQEENNGGTENTALLADQKE